MIGNYDLKALRCKKTKDKWRRNKGSMNWLAFRWAYEHLTKSSRRYLRTLPEQIRLAAKGRSILLTHGSPASIKEPLSMATPAGRLRELSLAAQVDVVVCGHSHQPFARFEDGVWFINPGSVGRSDDGDPRASYAILRADGGGLEIDHYRVDYDVEKAATEIRTTGLPEEFAQVVLQGRSLNALRLGTGDL